MHFEISSITSRFSKYIQIHIFAVSKFFRALLSAWNFQDKKNNKTLEETEYQLKQLLHPEELNKLPSLRVKVKLLRRTWKLSLQEGRVKEDE